MDTIFKHFGAFIKRSMLPASVLLLILILFTWKDGNIDSVLEIFNRMLQEKYPNATLKNFNEILQHYSNAILFIVFILLISISYFMAISTQIIFDNRLKKNFHSYLFYKEENLLLESLREKSIEKLEEENNEFNDVPLTDYTLYQILGRKLQFLRKETNTKRYIDEIKSSGSIFIAFIFAFLIQTVIKVSTEDDDILNIFIGCLFIGVIFFIAIEYLRSKYRSRSIRIYVNYLIGDNE